MDACATIVWLKEIVIITIKVNKNAAQKSLTAAQWFNR